MNFVLSLKNLRIAINQLPEIGKAKHPLLAMIDNIIIEAQKDADAQQRTSGR